MASCEKKYTILLLSAPIGSGHKLAAQALEQSFALADNVQVVHGSIFDFFPGSIGNAFLRFYLWVLSYCPWLYEIVVTKAGGLTAAETLIAGCNYIIYKPLPGQETGNAVYLEQYCGAQVAGSPQEVKTMVCRYADVDSQVRLLQRQQRSLKYGKPGAAEEISNYILKKLEK